MTAASAGGWADHSTQYYHGHLRRDDECVNRRDVCGGDYSRILNRFGDDDR